MFMHVSRIEGIDVLTLEGRFDAHTVPAVNQWLEEKMSGESPLVAFNLQDVNFIDSAGLATIVKGMKRSRELGGNLVIYNLQQPVKIIFELTRLDKAVGIFDNQKSAMASISQDVESAG
jgi:anti-anti-sigma factor